MIVKLDTVHAGDARHMDEIEDGSVHLVVTSPPYNVEIDYGAGHDDNIDDEAYLKFTRDWIAECIRVLVPGGRIAINVANTGRKPYRYLNMKIVNECLAQGLLARQEFIWFKGYAAAAAKTSWGSWCDVRNPITRDAWILSMPSRAGRARIALESTYLSAGEAIRQAGITLGKAGSLVKSSGMRAGSILASIGRGYGIMLRDRRGPDLLAIGATVLVIISLGMAIAGMW